MKMLEGQLSILLIIYIRSSSCDLESVYNTGKELWKLYLMIDNMTSYTSYSAFQLYKHKVNEIDEHLQKLDNSMNLEMISDAFKSKPYPITLYKSLDILEIFLLTIDQCYVNFRQQISKMTYHGDDLRLFMRSMIPDVEEKIITIRRKVLEPNELLQQNLIFAITGHAVYELPHLCKSQRIISEVLFQLFKLIAITEMKAHIISATVNRYQYSPRKDSGWINHLSRETLKNQIGHYVNLFTSNIQITDGVYLRACEPLNNNWIRDESFYELEGTFQTAIFGYDWKKCNVKTCHDIWYEEAGKCESHYYDDRSGCSGHLTECIELIAIQACILKNGPYKFHHVNSSTKGLLGIPSKCPNSNSYIIEDGSGVNSSHSTCACICNGNNNKISLSIVESDVKSNMVITGLRFIRQDGILCIQLREGKLYSDGRIRPYSQRWIPIPKNIPESEVHAINRNNGVFFFDSLRLPWSFVLTGVQFDRVKRKSETGFAIKIFGAPFNFESGELNSDPKFLISRQTLENDPGEPLLFEAVNSAKAALPLTLSPTNKNYVSLERSSLRDDFGQSTLPFFDAVPVITNPPSPLGGISIFHKGNDNNAGFISIRVYGLKYAQYFTNFQDTFMKNDSVLFD